MIESIVTEITEKYPSFKLEKFLQEYEEGKPREYFINEYQIPDAILRRYVALLGLEWVKFKRPSSLINFRYRLSLELDSTNVEMMQELEDELIKMSEKNRKLYQSLTLVRDENNMLRRESRNEVRQSSLEEKLYESFDKYLLDYKFNSLQETLEEKIVRMSNIKDRKQENGLCLILSDIHFGSKEKKEECGAEINSNILKNRLLYMAEKIITNPYQSENLTVFDLLDTIVGLIHGGNITSEDGISGSILNGVDTYVELYTRLAPNYKTINVYVTGDNHSRVTLNVSTYQKWDNFSIMMMKMVERLLQAKGITNVKFHYTKNEYIFTEINTAPILAFHGDTVRGWSFSSKSSHAQLQAICLGLFNKPFKHTFSGHTHNYGVATNHYGGNCLTNGTLIDGSSYGISSGFQPIHPAQSIVYIDEKGDMEQISFVNLNHIQE